MEKFALIFIASTLLLSNFTSAKSRWTRDVYPPNMVSTFHRPWYAGRREAKFPKKVPVFKNAPLTFRVIESQLN